MCTSARECRLAETEAERCERAYTDSLGVHVLTHMHTLWLCVDLRVNEWMIEGCRGCGEQRHGNNPSFPGREYRTRVRDKEGIEKMCVCEF